MPNIGDYESTYASFSWETPERFNFGRDVIDRRAEEEERPALLWLGKNGEEESFTFRDISRLSNRFANAARELGIERGDRVMVLLGKVPQWHVVLTGLLKVGAIAIPCADQLRAHDLEFRAEHSGSVAIISGAGGVEEVEEIRDHIPSVKHYLYVGGEREGWNSYDGLMDGASEEFTAEDTGSDEGAYLLYTSGTTKNPKGVLHTHGYTHAKRMEAYYWLDLQEGDRLWCTAGTGWAKSIWNVFLGPWSWGTEIFMHEGGFDPVERLRLIERYGITVLCQAPTEYRLVAKRPELAEVDLSSVRHATSAGEPLNPEVIERWKEAQGITVYDGYGQTENTLLVGNFPGLEVRPGSMGKPSPGCDVRIIDERGEECPPGEPGDIALRGRIPALFKEYWKQPDETAAVFRGEYYITGDRATKDEDGYFWFMGRADDVILSAGYRIGPFEVESALIEHPAVVESAVVAAPDEDRGSIVKAYVVLASGYEPSDELVRDIQEHCKKITAPYKYPRAIEFIDELPKTASGKIRRVELRQREAERAGSA
ncbi:acyl-CoA synthetase [Rubrobacter taiwanensis]|uniref:Acyl-CoA synthetase n=1 Tax=Rubrobacter taiwanensis TaxID=185139 RepID=A0A4R1BDC1_9ACTN|nr:acyl--CoA ligase [Rubrobacter taiwanensis]TCJ15069.1 acyl-CoA synthetase [Rubrobacter taiwanensis]